MKKTYEEYKKTGLKWLPKIPAHWEWSFLSQVATEKKTKKPKNIMFPVMSLSYGQIIQKKNINTGLVPNNYDNYQLVSKGDIILRFTDLQNDHTSLRTGLVKEKGIITSAYTNIRPRIYSSFLAYLLHSYDTLKIFYGLGGGVRQSIGFKDVRYLQLPVPPRSEQEQIVRFLDWKVSSINKLLNIKQQEIAELKELKKASIQEAVTHGINKNVPMKNSGIAWLGKIPKHWEMNFLSQISTEQKIKKPKNEMFPIMSLSYGQIIRKKNIDAGLVPTTYDNYQMVYAGNIILRFTDLQNDHTSLRSGLVKEEGIITSAYTNIKPAINSSFLSYLLHSYDNMKVFYGLGGGVRQSIGFKDVRYLSFPIPPSLEQEQIASFLDTQCLEIDRLIEAKQAQITDLHDLKSSLIANVVTGQIDVRDVTIPDYETVEELVRS